MKVAIIHGFNVSDGGERSVGWIAPKLRAQGFDVRMVRYGWVGPFRLRLRNRKVVAELLQDIKPDVIICHSNGAFIAWQADADSLATEGIIMIQPAIDRRSKFSRCRRVVCLHNRGDWAVQMGRGWRVAVNMLNPVSWFNRHNWGAAGFYGLESADVNINTETAAVPYSGHSIPPSGQEYWGKVIVRELLEIEND